MHLEKVMKTSHKIARENLRSSVSYNKRDYDQRLYQTSYNTGDLVYVLDPSNKPGVSAKLQFLEVLILSLRYITLFYIWCRTKSVNLLHTTIGYLFVMTGLYRCG